MLSMTKPYKQSMDSTFRNRSYMLVTIGVINQVAQKQAVVVQEHGAEYSYISNLVRLLDNYDVEFEYATMEQNRFCVEGRMLFPPRPENAQYLFNQGAVSKNLLGSVCISFSSSYDIRGLTIDFGANYPVDFTITNGVTSKSYFGNNKGHWTTEDIFDATEYLLITPVVMVGGQNRLRIQKILMGTGISFENKKIQKSTKTEHTSLITEELPSVDFSLTAENSNRMFDVENKTSAIHYLEVGQEVTVRYGYEPMKDGDIIWMDGCVCNLSDWEADDDSVSFTAKDKISDLNDIFYGGQYRASGVTLYDLAVEVLTDAGLDERQYSLDEYLKRVTVCNPMPCVSHKECLQIIANAGRCRLYQERSGVISIRAAFQTVVSPERMQVVSSNATVWSNLHSVINNVPKYEYATMSSNQYLADGTIYLLPKSGTYLAAGFVSDAIADASGNFSAAPSFKIVLEAATKYYSLQLNFASNPATVVTIRTYFEGTLAESYVVPSVLGIENTIVHEFPFFDSIEFEFTVGQPNSRIFVDSVVLGDVTDYIMDYKVMTKSPKGIQEGKVAGIDVVQTVYAETDEIQNILQETIDVTNCNSYTFYLTDASYNLQVAAGGTVLPILSSSSYMVCVDVSSLSGEQVFDVSGKTYATTQKRYSLIINNTGTTEEWSNPLISDDSLAQLQAGWLGNYYTNNIEYEISYRGEPRLDAGDILFLENQYVNGLQIQIYEHKLTYNGGLSGTVKARRAINGQEGQHVIS